VCRGCEAQLLRRSCDARLSEQHVAWPSRAAPHLALKMSGQNERHDTTHSCTARFNASLHCGPHAPHLILEALLCCRTCASQMAPAPSLPTRCARFVVPWTTRAPQPLTTACSVRCMTASPWHSPHRCVRVHVRVRACVLNVFLCLFFLCMCFCMGHTRMFVIRRKAWLPGCAFAFLLRPCLHPNPVLPPYVAALSRVGAPPGSPAAEVPSARREKHQGAALCTSTAE